MAAVDQHRELHGAGPAEVAQRVEGGPDGPARVEDVVDQHHDLVVDARRGDLGVPQRPGRAQPQVVAVHGDVERARRDRAALDLFEALGQPAGERHPPGRDAEQDDVVGAVGPLQDLVRDPGQRPPDLVRLKHRPGRRLGPPRGVSRRSVSLGSIGLIGRMDQGTSFPASPDGA